MSSDTPRGDSRSGGRSSSIFERVRQIFGLGPVSVREDIVEALTEPGGEGADELTTQERVMLKNVLSLHDVRVEDVMVPRSDIVSVSIRATLMDVLNLFRTAGHSRLPVHGDTLDDLRGMVHIRDFVNHVASIARFRNTRDASARDMPSAEGAVRAGRSIAALDLSVTLEEADILRPVLFVPPSMMALDLLVKMQATRTHMALVIDEYGGTDGLASIEDIVEVIVGDIEDEHDEQESPAVLSTEDGGFIVDARVGLEELSRISEIDFGAIADAEDVDTLGGLITTLAGRVPAVGEKIAGVEDYEFEIIEADPRHVMRVKIARRIKPDPDGASSDGTPDRG